LIKDVNGVVIGFEKINFRFEDVSNKPEIEMEIV